VITLHAAQHGFEAATRDLEAALARVGIAEWRRAARLAARLNALAAFAAGLRILPAAREIAEQLEIDATASPETLLRSEGAPDLALGLNWAADLPSARARARFIASKVFPNPDSMRSASSLARRGNAGLVAAYAERLLWISTRAPSAIRAVRRARRSASGRSSR
jgi:hypothetical protein